MTVPDNIHSIEFPTLITPGPVIQKSGLSVKWVPLKRGGSVPIQASHFLQEIIFKVKFLKASRALVEALRARMVNYLLIQGDKAQDGGATSARRDYEWIGA
jgi:hypothetical protein